MQLSTSLTIDRPQARLYINSSADRYLAIHRHQTSLHIDSGCGHAGKMELLEQPVSPSCQSCAHPSWPRGPSLSAVNGSSFISDDELQWKPVGADFRRSDHDNRSLPPAMTPRAMTPRAMTTRLGWRKILRPIGKPSPRSNRRS